MRSRQKAGCGGEGRDAPSMCRSPCSPAWPLRTMPCTYDHRSYLSGAVFCFPSHPKILATPSLSSPEKAQGGDQIEPGALRVERMPKSQKAKNPERLCFPFSTLAHTESERQRWNPQATARCLLVTHMLETLWRVTAW